MEKGAVVDVLLAGQYPLKGSIADVFAEEKAVHVSINSPRGRWGLFLPQTWLTQKNGVWHVQIP